MCYFPLRYYFQNINPHFVKTKYRVYSQIHEFLFNILVNPGNLSP